MHFGALRRAIPDVSQRMLIRSLRALQRDGFLKRRVLDTFPPTVEYSLTPVGQSLLEQLRGLMRWSLVNQDAMRRAREAFDAKAARPGIKPRGSAA